MIRGALALLVLVAAAARAEVAMTWSASMGMIVVAHGEEIDAYDRTGEKQLWSAYAVTNPSSILLSPDGKFAAVLDGYHDRVAVVALADGRAELYETPSTPVAAAFFERDLWVVLRDQSRVRRITPGGQQTDVDVALDPALIAVSDRFVYVYSRADGVLQEIDPKSAVVKRTASIGGGGSDLDVRLPAPGGPPGAVAYLCRPTEGKIVTVDLVPMKSREMKVGRAPMELTFVPFGAGLALDPGTSLVPDPVKQVVFQSRVPSAGGALRQPTAVDRVMLGGVGVFTFDSSTGTLYRVAGRTVKKVASGLTATSFAITDDALFTWDAELGKLRRLPVGK